MAGGGRSTAPAMAVFVEAFRKRDPRVANIYFDTATLVEGETPEGLRRDVEQMRAIGLDRFLYGTDTPPPPASQSWASMRVLPLTDAEFRVLAANVAPYFPK
jgi:predicted TIM-barrel fold metal-dependent hydrolase